MYKVCIYNNNAEVLIHYPTANQEAPHIDELPLKEGLSMIENLSFSIYKNNPGYDSLFELSTKVKVIDADNNSRRFTGRVLNIEEHMDNNGLFYKEVTCEGALAYLNDTKQRANTFATTNPTDFLTQILNIHNSKVDSSKQIQVGNVDVTGSVAYTCNFKTTLEEILTVKEKIGGNIRVRETDGILYLDWLQSFGVKTVDIVLGQNMKDMVKGKDVTSLGTRIIPLGANNLTISSINGGLDYIDNANAVSIYGVIEKTVQYSDITDATELYNTCLADLPKYTQPLYLLESNALDLSFITGIKTDQFILGTNLHIMNSVMAIDGNYNVVQIDLDLLKPYDPKLTIANFPIKLTSTINDLRASSIQNNGVYNNVQIGDTFGIRAVRSDGKVTTTVNATEGLSIENQSKKVFFVDSNGVLRAIDGVFDDITTNNMIANLMRTSNTTDYIIFHDQYFDVYHAGAKRLSLGFDPVNNYPYITFITPEGYAETIGITALGDLDMGKVQIDNNLQVSGSLDFYGSDDSTNLATKAWVLANQANLATQEWVESNFQSKLQP